MHLTNPFPLHQKQNHTPVTSPAALRKLRWRRDTQLHQRLGDSARQLQRQRKKKTAKSPRDKGHKDSWRSFLFKKGTGFYIYPINSNRGNTRFLEKKYEMVNILQFWILSSRRYSITERLKKIIEPVKEILYSGHSLLLQHHVYAFCMHKKNVHGKSDESTCWHFSKRLDAPSPGARRWQHLFENGWMAIACWTLLQNQPGTLLALVGEICGYTVYIYDICIMDR